MTRTTGATTVTTEATTTDRRRRLPSLSVRLRITLTVAVLVTAALAGAGLIVHVVELGRIEQSVQREVEQELNEFLALQREGVDPTTGRPFDVESLLRRFLERNVPDDDELLVAWYDDQPRYQFPQPHQDDLPQNAAFQAAARPLVTAGGSTRIETERGEVRITSQPVTQGDQTGALLVVAYLDEDRAELNDTMRTYAIVALLSLFIVVGAAAWQSSRLLRPLRVLRETAEEIGGTDLSRRIPASGNDDITALTRTVNGMLARLEASFAGQRQFLDDAGHELRTPLTVLRGHLELLDLTDPAEVAETRPLLLDELDRMSRLVGDLILLAKSDRPDFLALEPSDPAALVTAVVTKARALGDREWVLELAPNGLPAELVVDGQRITQALLALADNAVKHTRPGGRVAIGATAVGATLRCWVHDDGPGVAPEDRVRIFQRFGRAVVPQGDDGFGLGLSIVTAIAHAHGGTAYLDPYTERGARFVMDLPAVRPAAATASTQEVRWPAS
ncbi:MULTISPECIES: sensor histidine kinase [Nocardioides]|uniref:histidine kinase n=1 Tax=Nocardioides vastitatis TaxID=2568655 RepID=A0ABW0ZK95_9ACTN|nr:HAMP domain-containing sensor histidine kinase [Nocardioides sp.]THI96114.1 HAMP domain-containing histidine kinase [Nocardioides sp.]